VGGAERASVALSEASHAITQSSPMGIFPIRSTSASTVVNRGRHFGRPPLVSALREVEAARAFSDEAGKPVALFPLRNRFSVKLRANVPARKPVTECSASVAFHMLATVALWRALTCLIMRSVLNPLSLWLGAGCFLFRAFDGAFLSYPYAPWACYFGLAPGLLFDGVQRSLSISIVVTQVPPRLSPATEVRPASLESE